jgi:hypothetical protein
MTSNILPLARPCDGCGEPVPISPETTMVRIGGDSANGYAPVCDRCAYGPVTPRHTEPEHGLDCLCRACIRVWQ